MMDPEPGALCPSSHCQFFCFVLVVPNFPIPKTACTVVRENILPDTPPPPLRSCTGRGEIMFLGASWNHCSHYIRVDRSTISILDQAHDFLCATWAATLAVLITPWWFSFANTYALLISMFALVFGLYVNLADNLSKYLIIFISVVYLRCSFRYLNSSEK